MKKGLLTQAFFSPENTSILLINIIYLNPSALRKHAPPVPTPELPAHSRHASTDIVQPAECSQRAYRKAWQRRTTQSAAAIPAPLTAPGATASGRNSGQALQHNGCADP